MRLPIIAAILLALPAPSIAAVLVSNLAEPTRDTSLINAGLWAAQSFNTDAASATFLDIRTVLGNAVGGGAVVAELHEGTPGGTLLTTFTVPNLAGPLGVQTLAPTTAVTLAGSTAYWLVLGVIGGGSFGWSYAQGNGFVGSGTIGNFNYSTDGGATWVDFGADNPYKFAVDVGLVPEPAAWAMLLTGFAAVGTAVRLNRRRTASAAA